MGFFDSVIEQTIDLLKRDGELSSCRILKAHPDCFHQSPLSKVTVTVSLGGAQVASAAMGDFLGTRSSGDFYGKSAEVTLDITVWSPLSAGGEAAWETASSLCGDLMFSGLGFTSVQCGEISYHSGAMALTLPCQAKIRLAFGKASGGEAGLRRGCKRKAGPGKGSGIMLIAKERPGVYWDYDASGVLWGSDSSNRWESPPCVKTVNKTGCIPSGESAMVKRCSVRTALWPE